MRAVALGFAVLAAIGYALASVLQAIGAGHGGGALKTMAGPAYLAGLALDFLSWLVSLVALRTLPVYVVQAILAGSLAVTVLLAWLVLGHRLRPASQAGVLVTIAALAVLAASSGPQQPTPLGEPARLVLALAVLPLAAAGLLLTHSPARDHPRTAAGCGALAGTAFGAAALCARVVRLPEQGLGSAFRHSFDQGLRQLVHELALTARDPLSWGLVGFAIAGMLLYAQGLELGAVGPVTALLWIAEVVVPSVAGFFLLGDTVRNTWWPPTVVALLAAVAAAAVLARDVPAQQRANVVG